MSLAQPVVIYPPDEDGGRRVRIDGTILGRALSVEDVAAILQGAGLRSFSVRNVVYSSLIEWRGGWPSEWAARLVCPDPAKAAGT